MPPAVRVGDSTVHGGTVVGPGVSTVLIGNMPAAVQGDMHVCALPPNSHPPSTPFPSGSTTVLVGGRGVLRSTDTAGCGAMAAPGEVTVMIG